MKAAEGKLGQAMQLRKSDFPEAIKAAEEAYRTAGEANEAFAPSMRAYIDVGPTRVNEWADATLTIENIGKGLAKDVRVRIVGDAETEGLTDVAAVPANGSEAVKLRLKMTASGSVPLAIQVISHRAFDGKEYTQEMIAQVDVSELVQEKAKRIVADLESRCPICKGLIKRGFKVTRCGCGVGEDLVVARIARGDVLEDHHPGVQARLLREERRELTQARIDEPRDPALREPREDGHGERHVVQGHGDRLPMKAPAAHAPAVRADEWIVRGRVHLY